MKRYLRHAFTVLLLLSLFPSYCFASTGSEKMKNIIEFLFGGLGLTLVVAAIEFVRNKRNRLIKENDKFRFKNSEIIAIVYRICSRKGTSYETKLNRFELYYQLKKLYSSSYYKHRYYSDINDIIAKISTFYIINHTSGISQEAWDTLINQWDIELLSYCVELNDLLREKVDI